VRPTTFAGVGYVQLATRPKDDDSRHKGTNPGGEMQKRQNDRDLRDELVKLRAEHRDLDDEIVALEGSTAADQLLVKRLKKKKLQLKDQIQIIEDQLLPDIIA
jgi:hypothetical protein